MEDNTISVMEPPIKVRKPKTIEERTFVYILFFFRIVDFHKDALSDAEKYQKI